MWMKEANNFQIRLLLSFCLIFCPFQPGVAYKSVAYKKNTQTLRKSYCLQFTDCVGPNLDC